MAALQAIEVPNDSPLRNPDQIPYSDPPPSVQNPTGSKEEDTLSMRELVHEIDSYVKLIDLEITSNPNIVQNSIQLQFSDSIA